MDSDKVGSKRDPENRDEPPPKQRKVEGYVWIRVVQAGDPSVNRLIKVAPAPEDVSSLRDTLGVHSQLRELLADIDVGKIGILRALHADGTIVATSRDLEVAAVPIAADGGLKAYESVPGCAFAVLRKSEKAPLFDVEAGMLKPVSEARAPTVESGLLKEARGLLKEALEREKKASEDKYALYIKASEDKYGLLKEASDEKHRLLKEALEREKKAVEKEEEHSASQCGRIAELQAQLQVAKGELGRRSAYELGLTAAWCESKKACDSEFLGEDGTKVDKFPGRPGRFNATQVEAWLVALKEQRCIVDAVRYPTIACLSACVVPGLYAVLSEDVHGRPFDVSALVLERGGLTEGQHEVIKCTLKCLRVIM